MKNEEKKMKKKVIASILAAYGAYWMWRRKNNE